MILRMYEYIQQCNIPNGEAVIGEIFGVQDRDNCPINLPDSTGPLPDRVLVCSSWGKYELIPIHDLIISIHCFKFDRSQLIEFAQPTTDSETTINLPIKIMDISDIPMFKALLDWFYTRDDLRLLYELIPEMNSLSPPLGCFDDLQAKREAEKVIDEIASSACYSACERMRILIWRAYWVAEELGIVEHRPWEVIDLAYRIYVAIQEKKQGEPLRLDLSNLAPLIDGPSQPTNRRSTRLAIR